MRPRGRAEVVAKGSCVPSSLPLATLILPEVFEPAGGQFRVADSVLNVLVAEIELNRARILAGVG